MNRWIDRQINRQIDRQIDRQISRYIVGIYVVDFDTGELNNDMSVVQLLSRGLMNESDPGGDETFEELFSRFAEMKGV